MDKQLSQMSFVESDSTPGLIDSDSEDLPPTIQDINNTSTPRDCDEDRGGATEEETVVLETNCADKNKEISEENAEDEDISIDSVGKVMPTPDEWTPPEWLSTPRGHSIYIYGWGTKRWNYDDYKEKVILCDYGFEFTTEKRDEGSCVMRLKTDENEIHKCRWKMLGRRSEHDEGLHSDDEDGHGEDLHSGSYCVGEQELYGDDELCMEIEGIDRTKKYGVPRHPPYVYDSPLPDYDSEDSDLSSALKESSTNVEEDPSTNQDMNGIVVGNGQDEEEVEEGIITSTNNVDDSEMQEDVSFMTLLEKADGASKMTMFIICFDEEIRRLQPGEPGAEDQVGFPEDEEWRYTAVKHLRLAQVESTELENGSYVILPNDNGEYEMTIFVDDPSDRKKPLEEKRFLYERHRMKENRYFGEVEPSHIYYGEGVGPYTLPLNFSSMKYRVDKECVAIGPFTFDIDNKDKWVIPNEILQELKEVQEATGLGFGAPSKKLMLSDRSRKRPHSPMRSRPQPGKSRGKKKQCARREATNRHLSSFDTKVADDMLLMVAEAFTSPHTGSRAMNLFVHAVAFIVEVDEKGHESILVKKRAESRKGGNETHAEQHLLDDLYGRVRRELKKKRHQYAKQYMILMVIHNMEQDGIGMDGSLCGDCICALNKFQRRCSLKRSMLKVIVPCVERIDETGDLRSISAAAKIRKRWEKCGRLHHMDFSDVEYVPCLMNSSSSADTSISNSSDTSKNDETHTVEQLIMAEKKRRKRRRKKNKRRRKHMQCCRCAEDEKHLFEI